MTRKTSDAYTDALEHWLRDSTALNLHESRDNRRRAEASRADFEKALEACRAETEATIKAILAEQQGDSVVGTLESTTSCRLPSPVSAISLFVPRSLITDVVRCLRKGDNYSSKLAADLSVYLDGQ